MYFKEVKQLENIILSNHKQINDWIEAKYHGRQKAVYTSVDIRNSGFKIAPVDTNLFPSGFNNLDATSMSKANLAFKYYLTEYYPNAKLILIIPENFTRNHHYFQSLANIIKIIKASGKDVIVGSTFIEQVTTIDEIDITPIQKKGGRIETLNGCIPDVVILNNDLTSGMLPALKDITQDVIPSPLLGWYKRRKSLHFKAYNLLLEELAKEFNFDPWLLSTLFSSSKNIDFKAGTGIQDTAQKVDELLALIQNKYSLYQITSTPYVYIKADNGTFGMGVMCVKSGEELLHINKKRRHSMNVIKEGIVNSEIIIQEGIPTIHMHNSSPAENMIYMIAGNPIASIIRTNPSKDRFASLNHHNMQFHINKKEDQLELLVARIATLAVIEEQTDS